MKPKAKKVTKKVKVGKVVVKTPDSLPEKISVLTDTIDSLAVITAKGFSDVKNRLDKVEERLDDVNFRLGKIEANHERRIDNLEDRMRIIYTTFEKELKIKLPK